MHGPPVPGKSAQIVICLHERHTRYLWQQTHGEKGGSGGAVHRNKIIVGPAGLENTLTILSPGRETEVPHIPESQFAFFGKNVKKIRGFYEKLTQMIGTPFVHDSFSSHRDRRQWEASLESVGGQDEALAKARHTKLATTNLGPSLTIMLGLPLFLKEIADQGKREDLIQQVKQITDAEPSCQLLLTRIQNMEEEHLTGRMEVGKAVEEKGLAILQALVTASRPHEE